MQIADLSKKMLLTIIKLSLVSIAIAAVYYRSLFCTPFVFGVLLGAAVSLCKVFLLERAVEKAVSMERKAAVGYACLQHLLRLFLTGAVLILSALAPAISLWGATTGILTYQAAIYAIRFSAKS